MLGPSVRRVRSWTVSPERYARIAATALVLLCVIVVTGAAVRLSGSGLGCEDWPRCNDERFVDVSTGHGAIEQVNRLFTGLVAAGVILAVLAARRRSPHRRDLVVLAVGLVLGVIGQVVLGGVVVLTDLHPVANQGHFVLSMVLVANATILVRRARGLTRDVRMARAPRVLARATVVLGILALFTGTIVTGSGPHAGDEEARRFDLAIESVARVHGASVILACLAVLATIAVARRDIETWSRLSTVLEATIAIAVVQGVVGYVQYFNDIPALLVAVHIAGATAFMIALTSLWDTTGRTAMVDQTVDESRETVSSYT